MKKFISIFLSVLLLILQIPLGAFGESIDDPPIEEIEIPNLTIISSNVYTAKAGDTITINVKLKNTSIYDAYDIVGNLISDSPFVYVEGPTYDTIKVIRADGDTDTLSFKVTVDELADGGNYKLVLNVSYYNWERSQKFELPATINIRVSENNISPKLVINRVDIMPSATVNPGEVIAVGFEIENKGSGLAKDIKVTLNGLSNNGFTLANGVNYKTLQSVEPGKKSYVYFELKSSKTIKSGSYELNLDLSYKDLKNETYSDESNFFITVASNKNMASNLIIENLTYPTGAIKENQEVEIKFDLRNQGQSPAKNIIIEATSTDPSGLVPKSVSILKISSLDPGQIQNISFKFLTTQNAEIKNYPITITVKYTDDVGTEETIEQYVGIFVSPTSSDSNKSKPRLIIDKYSFEPQLVRAGENFQMKLSFYNTSSTKTVKNIKIFLTAEPGGTSGDSPNAGGSVFTPVDSSNTFYIDSIPPKGRVEKTITMFTVPDALAKTHTIIANFEYEDNEGNPLEDQERIGVPVVQQSKLDTSELTVYPDTMVGQPTPVSLEFYNTGKVTLYNLMVKLEGDFQTENGSYYVGNFPSGSSDYFEGMVIPNQPGEVKGAVVFTYEDSTGEIQEVRKEFTLNVMDMPPMEEFPSDVPPIDDYNPNGGGIKNILKSKWLWITLVVIAAAVGGVVFYRKKKRAKEMGLDE